MSSAADLQQLSLLRAAVDSVRDMIFVKDPGFVLVLVNRALAAAMDRAPADMEGHYDYEFWPLDVCEGDPATGRRGYHDEDREALAGKETVVTERVVMADGVEHIFETRRTPLRNAEGEVYAVLGCARDITNDLLVRTQLAELERNSVALRHAERLKRTTHDLQLFRKMIEQSSDAIYVCSVEDGHLLDCNQTAGRELGYSRAELLRLNLFDIQAASAEHRDWAAFRDSVQEHGGALMVSEHERSDGSTFPVEVNIRRVVVDGKPYFLSIARNISERVRTEEALRQAQKMKALGQLTGGIAHDFNNLLAMTMLNVDLAEGINHEPEVAAHLMAIQQSTRQAARLTRQLLNFSRPRVSELKSTRVPELLERIDGLIARSAEPGILIAYEIPDALWPVGADPGDLESALLNLTLNARHAMSGSGTLTISAENMTLPSESIQADSEAVPGDYVRLTVADTGVGIAPENLDRIFEPFFTTKAPGEGTGLGLSMVFGCMRNCGGFVRVDSRPNEGSAFHLYFRRLEPGRNRRDGLPGSRPEPRGSESVLLVDDEAALLRPLERAMSSFGYRVHTAANASTALEILAEHPEIQVIVSDVVMPGRMNGFALAETIAERYPGRPVLLTSGFPEDMSQESGQPAGSHFLMKPYSLLDLSHKIRELLDS